MNHTNSHSKAAHHCCGGCQSCHCHHVTLSQREQTLLMGLAQIPYLPIVRFVLASTKSEHLESVALAPVYLSEAEETFESVLENSHVLRELEQKNFISLDYDQPLQGCGYEQYHLSMAYRVFQNTVLEGSDREGFLFDIARMDCGSMALTSRGYAVVDTL
ncbi:MAG: hypothetical protein H6Q60_112 [Oscillospiraceae bacterium]|nr:hypothetical protein [Oscillospiraceae bacterium]